MPWQWGLFRGKRVLARVVAPNKPDVRDGRVDIRFKLGDPKVYPARAENVHVTPGELVTDEVAETPAAPSTPASRRSAAPTSKHPALERPWIAYTDGACTGNPGPAGSGLVLLDHAGKLVREAYRFLGSGTNNIAELTAVAMVYDHLPDGAGVVVHTDSKYAIGVLTQGWKAKANAELIAKIRTTLSSRPTLMKYVPGHSGVPLNERADELAREAIATRRSSG